MYISHPKIKSHTIENIEHGTLGKVNSIVIHRTAGGTAESTLNTWLKKKSGASYSEPSTSGYRAPASQRIRRTNIDNLDVLNGTEDF